MSTPRFQPPSCMPGSPVWLPVNRFLILSGTVVCGQHWRGNDTDVLVVVRGIRTTISPDGQRHYTMDPDAFSTFPESKLGPSFEWARRTVESLPE